MRGTVSVRFYDYAPGQETLYEFLRLYTFNAFGDSFAWAADYDAFCYHAGVDGTGPNQNCGIYPGINTTNIARTVGWHLFEIIVGDTSVDVRIDGNLAYSKAGDFGFQYVHLGVSGPFWRPNTIVYWDDFQVEASSAAVPEPSTPLMLAGGTLLLGILRRNRPKRPAAVQQLKAATSIQFRTAP